MCFVTALSEIGVGLIGVCKVNKPAKDSLVKKKEFVLKSRVPRAGESYIRAYLRSLTIKLVL